MENLNLTILSTIVVAALSLLLVLIWGILSIKSSLKERSIIKKFERMKKMGRFLWDETDD